MSFRDLTACLPDWVEGFLADPDRVYASTEARMRLVVELSRLNVEHGTGGPFGAGVFETETGRLVAPGVNRVVPANCSIAHAEILAIAIAQQKLQSYDLGSEGMPAHELVTSTEPCAMCLGAIVWSGVRGLVCGAREEDAQRVGFDEGPKLPDWVGALEQRGIAVTRDVLREEARAVLVSYKETGGPVYNGRKSTR